MLIEEFQNCTVRFSNGSQRKCARLTHHLYNLGFTLESIERIYFMDAVLSHTDGQAKSCDRINKQFFLLKTMLYSDVTAVNDICQLNLR